MTELFPDAHLEAEFTTLQKLINDGVSIRLEEVTRGGANSEVHVNALLSFHALKNGFKNRVIRQISEFSSILRWADSNSAEITLGLEVQNLSNFSKSFRGLFLRRNDGVKESFKTCLSIANL